MRAHVVDEDGNRLSRDTVLAVHWHPGKKTTFPDSLLLSGCVEGKTS